MPITFTIDAERAVIHERWSGEIRAAELGGYWRRILADAEVMAIRRTVVDLRDAVIEFGGAELATLVDEVVVPALRGRHWVTAIVVGAPVQVGVSNQYRVFASLYSQDALFRTPEAAVDWVLAQPLPA
jgi:hypothetical protein